MKEEIDRNSSGGRSSRGGGYGRSHSIANASGQHVSRTQSRQSFSSDTQVLHNKKIIFIEIFLFIKIVKKKKQ